MNNIKFVMQNQKTGEYWCPSVFPPLSKDVWSAEKFDSPLQAQKSLTALLGAKFNPNDFQVQQIELIQSKVFLESN